MSVLKINDIVVYPKTKPPHKTILRHLQWEHNNTWINIWITKCKNIFYISSPNHPISKYEDKDDVFILSHLFYLLHSLSSQLSPESIEYYYISIFLNGILSYFKTIYWEQYLHQDEVVDNIYQYYFPNDKKLSDENERLKNEILALTAKKETKEIGIQTSAWNTKLIFKNEISTQTQEIKEKKSKLSETSTDVIFEMIEETSRKSKNIDETSTESIFEIKENKKSNKKKKDKKNEDNVIFTCNEYLEMIKKQNNEIEKIKTETINNIKKNIVDFLKENPISSEISFNILQSQGILHVIDSFVSWSLSMACKSFYQTFISNGYDISKNKIIIPPFLNFWTKLILPNITKLKNPIFFKLASEWVDMMNAAKRCMPEFTELQIDICYSYYSTNMVYNLLEKQCFVPPFFIILLNSCRSVTVLTGLIKIYQRESEKNQLNETELLQEFFLLFLSSSPLEILSKNKDKIIISDYERILYNLGEKKEKEVILV